jgi:hypothetical protein
MATKPYSELRDLELELKVLIALNRAGGQLTQAQITMGPLRHLSTSERKKVLTRLRRSQFIDAAKYKSPHQTGPSAQYHRLTDKGRRALPAESSTKQAV